MTRHILSAAAITFALLATNSFGADDKKTEPPMHMHKSEMSHERSDAQVSTEYRSEAAQLRAKAESHRKMAQLYKTRGSMKGGGSYANVVKHCENLAKHYENAAKEAEAVSSELGK